MHLLQRVYGTMIAAAPDSIAARAVVDQAVATLGENDHCNFCAVMLEVPATIACADVGDLDAARRHLAVAESSSTNWQGTAWEAAVREARAHVARAGGHHDEFVYLSAEASRLFEAVGHTADAARCAAAAVPVA
jgi:hypothetical protein